MNFLPPFSLSAYGSALIRHCQVKSGEHCKRTAVRAYNLYDPNTCICSKRAPTVLKDQPLKRSRSNAPLESSSEQAGDNNPPRIQSISKLSSFANTLISVYKNAPSPTSQHSAGMSNPDFPRKKRILCTRRSSPSHEKNVCPVEDDVEAKSLQAKTSSDNSLRPMPVTLNSVPHFRIPLL